MASRLEYSVTNLINYYKKRCNGKWEHYHGIKIETIDNPGWMISVSVENAQECRLTFLFKKHHSKYKASENARSYSYPLLYKRCYQSKWIEVIMRDNKVVGACDENSLVRLLCIVTFILTCSLKC